LIGHLTNLASTPAISVAVSDPIVYLVTQSRSFPTPRASVVKIIDVSIKEQPIEVSELKTGSESVSVIRVRQNLAFVCTGSLGLQIWDVSAPRDPHQLGSYKGQDGYLNDIAVDGRIALLGMGFDGASILDVTDPTNPRELSRLQTNTFCYSVAYASPFAYVLNFDGIHIYDISQPSAPLLASVIPTGAYSLQISGRYAFVSDFQWTTQVFDVSDPRYPRRVGGIAFPISQFGFTKDRIYAAAGEGGFWNFQLFQEPRIKARSLYSVLGLRLDVEGPYGSQSLVERAETLNSIWKPWRPVVNHSDATILFDGEAIGTRSFFYRLISQ
jgi:hypothetical protein